MQLWFKLTCRCGSPKSFIIEINTSADRSLTFLQPFHSTKKIKDRLSLPGLLSSHTLNTNKSSLFSPLNERHGHSYSEPVLLAKSRHSEANWQFLIRSLRWWRARVTGTFRVSNRHWLRPPPPSLPPIPH